jgi:hypothetical protein
MNAAGPQVVVAASGIVSDPEPSGVIDDRGALVAGSPACRMPSLLTGIPLLHSESGNRLVVSQIRPFAIGHWQALTSSWVVHARDQSVLAGLSI